MGSGPSVFWVFVFFKFCDFYSMSLKRLSGLIPRHLQSAGIAKGVLAARVLQVANETIDELFGHGTSERDVRAVALKQGRLQIASIHSAYRQEIHDRATEIQEKVNTDLGEPMVKKVQVIL